MTPVLDPSAAQGGALPAAIGWIEAVLLGPVGTSIAVIAIAGIGYRMLTGEASVRQGLRVVMGVFILFGAPLIARELAGLARGGDDTAAAATEPPPVPSQVRPTNPPGFDPYAGAAVPGN